MEKNAARGVLSPADRTEMFFTEKKNDLQQSRKRELLDYIRSGRPHLLRESLNTIHPADLCDIIRQFQNGEMDELLGVLDNERLSLLLRFLCSDREQRFRLLWRLPHERLAQLISEMSRRSLMELFDGLPESQTHALLSQLPPEAVRKAEPCIHKQRGMAALITDDFMKVRDDVSIAETLRMFRELKHSVDRPNKIYIVDQRETLVGTADLHELILAPDPAESISKIAVESPMRLKSDDDPATAARTIIHYGLDNAPVTDGENALQGVVTARTAYKFLENEKETWLDSAACMDAPGLEADCGTAAGLLPRAGLLMGTMLAALAVTAAVAALMKPKTNVAILFPLTPLAIAVGRLYLRYSLILFQKQFFAARIGVSQKGRGMMMAAATALVFSVVSGAAALLIKTDLKLALFTGFTVFLSAVSGAVSGAILFLISRFSAQTRTLMLNPTFLSLSDILTLLAMYGMYAGLLK
jgi:magnesium transporter